MYSGEKKLFTIGPVEMFPSTLDVRSKQVPYFRNGEFSSVVKAASAGLQELAGAGQGTRTIMLTCSGTGAMEAVVLNCLGRDDKALVIDGGSFGHRFRKLLNLHKIKHEALELSWDEELTSAHLDLFANKGFTALLVNLDETSTGQLYNLDLLSSFCRQNHMKLIVDSISAFLSDPIDFDKAGIDALIVSSQKALSLAPGLSCVILSERVVSAILEKPSCEACPCMYFDFADYLSNGLRGQTPFTPAVGVVYELRQRVESLIAAGGTSVEIERVKSIAEDFRSRLTSLPISIPSFPLSNALTPIIFDNADATAVLSKLEEQFGYVLNPCGGERTRTMARVAHVGNHSIDDNICLIDALSKLI